MQKRGSTKDSKKKADLNLGLTFIISLIIIAFITVAAFYTLRNFSCRSEQAQVLSIITSMKEDVERTFYASQGSQIAFRFEMPQVCNKIERICFANPNKRYTTQIDNKLKFFIDKYKGKDMDLFFYPPESYRKLGINEAYDIPFLNATINPNCYTVEKEVKLLFENEGKYVIVK
ncbi:MAG: hypothetical protein AABX59_03760 [Nanoarchaeota archaeon]